MIKLNICSLGDPTSRNTWSGTPYNLYSELVMLDRLGAAFDSDACRSKLRRLPVLLSSRVYYSKSAGYYRGLFFRYLNSNRVKKMTKNASDYTLHTGSLDLPFFRVPENKKHYLFCDATWNLWSSHSTMMKGYSKKLISDAEKLEKQAYNQMEHIFPISEYVKENLISHYRIPPEKITVVGTGLGVIKPFYGQKDYSNGKILFAAKGRFEDKGGPLVLEAFQKALMINPKLELTIVGQNEYTGKINLPKVRTLGFIPIEKLQSIFNESSLFLMPAVNEPWGLVYLEALACKMPIVGLNRYGFPEISGYGKYGFGMEELSSEKLAELITKVFADPKKLAEMGKDGQGYCLSKFTWQNVVMKIINTIEGE